MSQDRQPALGPVGGSVTQQSSQFIGQQMSMSLGPGPQQRLMMGSQMPNLMCGLSTSQPQMYMPSSQQPPGPPVSPAGRPPAPQQQQHQQMQNLVQKQSSQLSPAPPLSSDHGSPHEINTCEDLSGDSSRGSTGCPRPSPSPVGSAGSRSNTLASISGTQAGSPMPVRPLSGQADGQSRLTQSPMATPGYNQQMMPPPNSMGYMHPSGKTSGSQAPGHYPQYNSQYPQGNYGRQPNMGAVGGPPLSGSMPNYPGSQPHMYPNGPGQVPGPPVYGNMPGMVRNMSQQGYSPGQGPYSQGNANMAGMMNSHYPGYNTHMAPVTGHHGMQQALEGSSPAPPGSVGTPAMIGQHTGLMPQQHISSNKAPQAAQTAMLAAANSPGPRMSHSRGSMSPSRGMFIQSAGCPLTHMSNITNSPNLGSPSLNSMSNAVEQLSRSSLGGISSSSMGNMNTSASSPLPKSPHIPTTMTTNTSTSIANSSDCNTNQQSPLSNAETHESFSRPGSATDRHTDLPNESNLGSYNSGGITSSDSTSVDSGFHSSDQSDKTPDSVSTPTQSVSSPPLSNLPPNGDASRTIENISPPDYPGHHPPHPLHHHHLHQQQHLQQQHYHMGTESKMPYSSDGMVPLPLSAMSSMPSSNSIVVTTVNAGPLLTSVTQSIASPVTSVSTSASPNHLHPHPHMLPHGGPPHNMMAHGMGPSPHGMMPNGMPPSSVMSTGHMGGPNQMPPEMGGYMYGMTPPNMGGPNMNMNQNGPLLGPMMAHNGPMSSGHPGINSESNSTNMPMMNQIPQQQHMNCLIPAGNNNKNRSSKNTQDDPPEKKRKQKDVDNQGGSRISCAGPRYSEESNNLGALKPATSDLSKLFELGPEPDRRHFLERIFAFLDEGGQPVTALPVISKTPLDLYKLYFSVREKGGFEEVTRSKKWRDICTVVNIGTSASAAFTLKKNYIRYLLNYECKFDRGGINPAPILAQMEAQLAHKREQKNKRAPSPAGSNSNESFRPPSVPNNPMDTSSFQPQNMHPPYMQNPDGNMPNHHMSGSVMMGSNNMMGTPGPHGGMGSMMAGPTNIGPSGMIGGSGPGMMHGQQGMMIQNSGTGSMMSSQMPAGSSGYGSMLQQQLPSSVAIIPPPSSHGGVSAVGSMPTTSDTPHDPFSDTPSYQQQHAGSLHPTPPPQVTTSTQMGSGYTGIQQSSVGNAAITSSLNQPIVSAVGYGGPDQGMSEFRISEPAVSATGGQFPFEPSDRSDQPNANMAVRPPAPTSDATPQQQPPQQPGDSSSVYPGSRFPGPHPAVGMRLPQGSDGPGQYSPPGPPYQGQGGYPGSQYHNYPQNLAGPRPPLGPGGMYGTPVKRLPEDPAAANQYSDWSDSAIGNHLNYSPAPPDRQASSPDDRMREGGQWSPVQRPRIPQSGLGYMSPAPPSTPPMGQYSRQMSHKSSPQSREQGRLHQQQKMPPSYGGLAAASLARKEVTFPADSVESVKICTTKRKKLTNKDLAPFEPWRLMLALKSGLLAESTWALDTLNILLYDDTTYGYFGLNTLPGLLEVLTEHFRHCLIQMFPEFESLEASSKKQKPQTKKIKVEPIFSGQPESPKNISEDETLEMKEKMIVRLFSDSNYTMVSRKGLPVKFDHNPADSTVMDEKNWDVFSNFDSKSDHWVTGHGDMTDHILTHLERDSSRTFLSGRFRRKRAREADDCNERVCNGAPISNEKRKSLCKNAVVVQGSFLVSKTAVVLEGKCEKSVLLNCEHLGKENCEKRIHLRLQNSHCENSNSAINHSSICMGEKVVEETSSTFNDSFHTGSELQHVTKSNGAEPAVKQEEETKSFFKDKVEGKRKRSQKYVNGKMAAENVTAVMNVNMHNRAVDSHGTASTVEAENASKPLENGHLEECQLSPILKHQSSDRSPSRISEATHSCEINSCKVVGQDNDISDGSPPLLRAGCLVNVCDKVGEGVHSSCVEASMETNVNNVEDISSSKGSEDIEMEEMWEKDNIDTAREVLDDVAVNSSIDTSLMLSDNCTSETEELSASIVSDMLKEDEHLEEEAFQRDDPPLCLTPESKDELGRRCVCISNIFRSLSCVPGNEDHISRHPGIMRLLSQLLLLHHGHPEKPPTRKLAYSSEEEEEREQSPRLYDDEHWWWDYLDQLRENALVIIANICGHLKLGNFSEQVCLPLLEGLLHWVICPASVARDPLPTLPAGSVLSPQRLVLEALCKLCINETNVDLLLATPPIKRLLELFSVLVRLLADRNHQITREFSIVLLSLLVSSESSTARAVALQHPSVSLLVDFIETAEQNALTIANQQGFEILQVNPEIMGTSLDMLRRAASILLHMARVPDNRKMFVQQQGRLLKLVMSQILDQSVSNTLSEVLFECS